MGADAQGFALDDAALKRRAEGFLRERAARAIDLYRRRYPGSSASELYIQMWSDFSIADATLKQADRKAALEASRAPAADRAGVYVYRFDWRSPALGGKLKSPHSIENAFVWNDLRSSPLTASAAPSAARLAQQVSQAWRSFAATGAPSPPAGGLPAWPAYDPGRRAVMLLDEGSRMVDDPFREERQLFA
jgi:para-nitrobenzyl esterase